MGQRAQGVCRRLMEESKLEHSFECLQYMSHPSLERQTQTIEVHLCVRDWIHVTRKGSLIKSAPPMKAPFQEVSLHPM